MSSTSNSIEQTLSIIKPDAYERREEIIPFFTRKGLSVIAAKTITRLTPEQAKDFYAVHKDRPFYDSLVKYMTSGSIFVMVLEGEKAIIRAREIMGPIRAKFGTNIEQNAVHGSDSSDTAPKEIAFFFKIDEIMKRSLPH